MLGSIKWKYVCCTSIRIIGIEIEQKVGRRWDIFALCHGTRLVETPTWSLIALSYPYSLFIVLLLAQFCALMPIYGITTKSAKQLKFTWINLRVLHTMILLFGVGAMIILSLIWATSNKITIPILGKCGKRCRSQRNWHLRVNCGTFFNIFHRAPDMVWLKIRYHLVFHMDGETLAQIDELLGACGTSFAPTRIASKKLSIFQRNPFPYNCDFRYIAGWEPPRIAKGFERIIRFLDIFSWAYDVNSGRRLPWYLLYEQYQFGNIFCAGMAAIVHNYAIRRWMDGFCHWDHQLLLHVHMGVYGLTDNRG